MNHPMPEIVSAEQWATAREDLLAAEKNATHVLDEVAARRRRLPMVRFPDTYSFTGPDGPVSLLDLFDGHEQLVVYQFMDRGPENYCEGCSWFTANVPDAAAAMLAESDVAWTVVSEMPYEQLDRYWTHRGWTQPHVSSRGTTFAQDTGAGGGFLLNVFLRRDDEVFRTYTVTSRGIDRLAFVTHLLDLTPYGRQEEWEDSPEGWPQTSTAERPAPFMSVDDVPISFGRFRKTAP